MKLLVPVRPVPDPATPVRLMPDRDGVMAVDRVGAKLIANPFDDVALEEALLQRERGCVREVVTVAVAPWDEGNPLLRMTLAMGADRAVLVTPPPVVEPWTVATLLHALCLRESIGMVIMGKQSVDEDGGRVGPMLAMLAGWGLGVAAVALELPAGDGCGALVVTQEVAGGTEQVRLSLPAVVTVEVRLNTPRYPSLTGIMQARRRTVEQLEWSELIHPAGLSAPTLQRLESTEPPPRSRGRTIATAGELVHLLRQGGGMA